MARSRVANVRVSEGIATGAEMIARALPGCRECVDFAERGRHRIGAKQLRAHQICSELSTPVDGVWGAL